MATLSLLEHFRARNPKAFGKRLWMLWKHLKTNDLFTAGRDDELSGVVTDPERLWRFVARAKES